MSYIDVLSLREKYNNKLITFKETGGVFFIEDIQIISSLLVEISCIETNSFMKSKRYAGVYNIEAYIDVLS